MKRRVLMAMSGGIDSSVAAVLLQEQGYELVGATFRNYDLPCQAGADNDAIRGARALAAQMNFEHHTLDVRTRFRETVVRNFTDEYLRCRTPNPCVLCNPTIKWGELLRLADTLHCDLLATGHYARIGCHEGRHFIRKGKDTLKDQSYFLWRVPSEFLARTLFPLGDLTKPAVRDIAAQHGFVQLTEQKESEEICFIPDNNYRNFLKQNIPDLEQRMGEGDFVDTNGKVLGRHKGLYNYTIGQRKGLGIALGVPAYVVALDAARNRVVIGYKKDLQAREMLLEAPQMMKYGDFADGDLFDCKIRYRSHGVPARLFHENDAVRVRFEHDVESVTPGQSAVFYEGDDLVGGGIIAR